MEPEKIHRILLGAPVTETHLKLYEGYPSSRGFSTADPSREEFEAAFMLALAQVLKGNQLNRTFLFVPASKTVLFGEMATEVARRMFARLKGTNPIERRRGTVEKLSLALKHLMFGSRVLQMEREPAHWAALGFQQTDPIPEWLRAGLVSV